MVFKNTGNKIASSAGKIPFTVFGTRDLMSNNVPKSFLYIENDANSNPLLEYKRSIKQNER